ncbi:hypothetical protein [Gimibacter soli]|uniref:Uncharacterized protein n=1 Tax=Gimibacter soli TaxID=3024400 RepID=A0AAE9XPC7_9PROT|nr:hypothetical protein [Gimibacter soli]WCL52581.1 hypothetical protein PH603_08510 [Gimibacter soli]
MTHPSEDDAAKTPEAKPAARAPIVIEASWAPKDPRDKLYDDDATASEKAGSVVRIVAAFHPVLNFFLIIFDLIRNRDWRGFLMLGVFALLILGGAWLFVWRV